jgi:hypothetical protein
MDLDYVGYMFDLLEPAERERAEAALRDDPVARARLDKLRPCMAPLALDREVENPPVGLADRTIDRVAAQIVHDRPQPSRRAIVPESEPVFAPSRWRRMDALVAAGIMVMIGGLGVSGVGHIQKRQDRMACQNNMRQLHTSLVGYCDSHDGRFPEVSDLPPNNVAGSFATMLQESGQLPPTGVPACPTVKVAGPSGGYAYSLGYRGPDGQLHGLRRGPAQENDLLPILSDRPSPTGHGTGHNVLYIGGNVVYATTPKVGVDGDDIFFNQADHVAAGLHKLDTVLAPDNTPP